MFVREKRIGAYRYLYLVETVREDGKTKQRIIRNLGRKEAVEASGDLDRLARSAARLSQRSMILSLIEDGGAPDVTCRRIGAPLLFEGLWQESGCRAVVEGHSHNAVTKIIRWRPIGSTSFDWLSLRSRLAAAPPYL